MPEHWGGVTDPELHDANNFRYLVHAFNTMATMSALMGMRDNYENGITPSDVQGDQGIDLYEEPELVNERITLSMLLIDQAHTTTWGEGGLIIGASPEDIVVTSPTDFGTNNNNLDHIMERSRLQSVVDGTELLQQTSPTSYNEVVAIAKQGTYPLEVKGFFIKTTSRGEPLNPVLADKMQLHAQRLNVPVVAVPIEARYKSNRVDIQERGKLAIEFGGRRYTLDGYGENNFKAYDEHNRSLFPLPRDIEAAVAFSVDTGQVSTETAAAILNSYAVYDMQRQTPIIRCDEEGTINSVFCRTGYDVDEAD